MSLTRIVVDRLERAPLLAGPRFHGLTVAAVRVRCRACGAATSEWAACCPQCRSPLDDAEPVDDAQLTLRRSAAGLDRVWPRRVGRRSRRPIAWGLALLVAVISSGAGWAIATGWAGHASSK